MWPAFSELWIGISCSLVSRGILWIILMLLWHCFISTKMPSFHSLIHPLPDSLAWYSLEWVFCLCSEISRQDEHSTCYQFCSISFSEACSRTLESSSQVDVCCLGLILACPSFRAGFAHSSCLSVVWGLVTIKGSSAHIAQLLPQPQQQRQQWAFDHLPGCCLWCTEFYWWYIGMKL